MARAAGRNGSVKNGTVTVANITDWTIQFTRPTTDVTCMGDVNAQSIVGLAAVSGTISGILDDATAGGSTLFAEADGTTLTLELLITTGEGFTGLAYLDYSASMSVGAAGTFSCNFTSAGPWAAL